MSNDGAQGEHSLWMAAFDIAWREPGKIAELSCPRCTTKALQLVYGTPTRGATQGLFAFWCGACMHGIPPGFGPVPPGAAAAPIESMGVPDYRAVVPD